MAAMDVNDGIEYDRQRINSTKMIEHDGNCGSSFDTTINKRQQKMAANA